MGRYRKLPVEVDAIEWSGSNWHQALAFAQETGQVVFTRAEADGIVLLIPTLEGEMAASPGDWIIRGVQGEVYPCKPDIFEATYEPVDDPRNRDDNPHPDA